MGRKLRQEPLEVPEMEQVEAERSRLRYRRRYFRTLRSTISVLLVTAALAVLAATFWIPVLQIYGTSMTPTLQEGDIVVCFRTADFQRGDLVAFYLGNKVLVKRYIAGPGQWVDLDEDGTVYVDGERLEEPYVSERAFGDCNLTLPYQVPESRYFCMGDHRATSVDSRHTEVGCVAEEQMVGKIAWRIWPLARFGRLE